MKKIEELEKSFVEFGEAVTQYHWSIIEDDAAKRNLAIENIQKKYYQCGKLIEEIKNEKN